MFLPSLKKKKKKTQNLKKSAFHLFCKGLINNDLWLHCTWIFTLPVLSAEILLAFVPLKGSASAGVFFPIAVGSH